MRCIFIALLIVLLIFLITGPSSRHKKPPRVIVAIRPTTQAPIGSSMPKILPDILDCKKSGMQSPDNIKRHLSVLSDSRFT
jgi:hypothetical protein